ncbi:MAG: radical SAM protein [Acidobacteriota bacterium]
MRVLMSRGNPAIATVFVGKMRGKLVEFVESRQPPIPWDRKWVLILSVSFGCPVRCAICDAGGSFAGHLSAEEMLAQVEYLVARRFPERRVPVDHFKIQFARMGEPALNDDVLRAMGLIRERLSAPGLMFCVSTIAPAGREPFFEELARVKDRLAGRFQLQFSVHSTDEQERDRLMPARKWSLDRIAAYGRDFWNHGDRKITLNFALHRRFEVSSVRLARLFDPARFLVKLTPVNPTDSAGAARIDTAFESDPDERTSALIEELRGEGFDVLLSAGELEENRIGSNCGQLVARLSKTTAAIVQRSYGGAYSLDTI